MKVLVVVDMQNDFIDGALGTEEAKAIIYDVNKKIAEYREAGEKVIFTRDTHDENYLATREGRNLPVVHCVKGTQGWEISGKLDTTGSDIIDKPTFGSYDLVEKLADEPEIESIELIGVCTDICVISNAILLKAKFTETPIIVDASCCAGVTPASHETALEAMKMCQIEVLK